MVLHQDATTKLLFKIKYVALIHPSQLHRHKINCQDRTKIEIATHIKVTAITRTLLAKASQSITHGISDKLFV